MDDLLTNPIWQEETLGQPIPPSLHAVSVSLPCWKHVLAYEDGDPVVLERLKAGYPRFFMPLVNRFLQEKVLSELSQEDDECCLILPSRDAAKRATRFILDSVEEGTVSEGSLYETELRVLYFPSALQAAAKLYWRFSGETVSSRRATAALENRPDIGAAGQAAKQTIRERLARLAGVSAGDVFIFPSGMAAVFAVHRMLMAREPKAKSVQLDFPYVDVLKIQEKFGKGVHFYPVVTEAALRNIARRAATQKLSGVFCEAPSNPLLSCVPMARLSESLQPYGVPLVIDDTIATVVNVSALKYADVITTSLTKAFSGAGDVLAGAVTLNPNSQHYAVFRAWMDQEMATNDIFWGEDAVVLEANSRDFPKRVRRASQNAAALVDFLQNHPAVDRVYYPALADEGIREILRPHAGRGCLLSFTLKDPSRAPQFYDALRVGKGPSLGTNFTLCCPYTLLAHYTELEWAASCGVPPHLLRVSVGLEEIPDLLERFSSALAASASNPA